MGSSQRFPSCLTQPMLAGSRMDLPLTKVEPIRNGASTCDKIFKKEEK